MGISWASLYLRSAEQEPVSAALRESLTALGYQLYDPFGLIPGRAYPKSIRLFIAPSRDGWVRILGIPDERLIAGLSHVGLCLSALLHDNDESTLQAHLDGKTLAPQTALAVFSQCAEDEFQRAFQGENVRPIEQASSSVLGTLSGDAQMQALSSRVDPQQAQKMFDRLSGGLMKKAGGDASAAQNLLNAAAPDWNSTGGRRIRAVLDCLGLPWQEPEFTALRDSYQLHVRRKRTPNARLYPGDEDAMNRVPDALAYIPVYGGQ